MGSYFKLYPLAHSLADFQFPILIWDDLFLVEPCVHAVFPGTARHIVPEVERVGGQVWSGGPFGQRADGVTGRVGMAEEYLVTEH